MDDEFARGFLAAFFFRAVQIYVQSGGQEITMNAIGLSISLLFAIDVNVGDRLPIPCDHIAWDKSDFERFFHIEKAPRFAKKNEFPGAGANDTIVWTLKAKKAMEHGVVGSIFGRRYAVFQKGTESFKTETRIARLPLKVDDRFRLRRAALSQGETIEAWVVLGKNRGRILDRADRMWIDIELE